MTRWNRDEAESSWLFHAAEDRKSDDNRRRGGKGGEAVLILLPKNAEMKQ